METAAHQAKCQNSPRVIAIGALMVDLACTVDRLPLSGEGIVPESTQVTLGGCALNSTAAAQRLGVAFLLFSPVGQGIFAGFVRDRLRDTSVHGFEIPGATWDNGGCVCLVEPDGQRTMITLPGIERHFCADWFQQLGPQTDALTCGIACGYELDSPGGDAIVSFFEQHPHIKMFYAPGPRVCHVTPPLVDRIKALHAVWHLNDQEICSYTGLDDVIQAGNALAAECHAPVIVTGGADGAWAFLPNDAPECDATCQPDGMRHPVAALEPDDAPEPDASNADASEAVAETKTAFSPGISVLHVPTAPVTPVDTIGAGDAHLGALVALRSQGADWQAALEAANAIAAEACQRQGALPPLPAPS